MPDFARGGNRSRRGGPERLQREEQQRRRGALGIIDQRREIGGRRIGKVQLSRIDDPVEMRARQPARSDRRDERLYDLVPPGWRSGIGGVHDLAPPLQPDLPEHRLGHGFPHPRDLVIEGIERKQRLAAVGRREQRGLIAIAIVTAHDRAHG